MTVPEPFTQEVDVVIIGAGVVGLTLAHSLQKVSEFDHDINGFAFLSIYVVRRFLSDP